VSIKAFGAFVQLEGHRRQGLVHISQLASQRVESTADVVGEGDKVKVKVLAIEGERSRSP